MGISDELIERFFKNECNVGEAEFIINYLKEYPEELKKYTDKNEWNKTEVKKPLPLAVTEDMWDIIKAQTKPQPGIIWLKRAAVAACVMGLLFFSYQWLNQNNESSVVADLENKHVQVSPVNHKVISNTSGKEMLIALIDGSVIKLESKSELRYDEPFQNNRRDITLSGKAFFKVAKDKTKPFTVTAGGLSTTALGTSFWVDANKLLHKINVRLLTGKVVIAKVAGLGIKNFKPVYLTPGEELKFETISEKSLVQNFYLKIQSAAGKKSIDEKKNIVPPKTNQKIVFNNTPLNDVFKTLEKKYNISISFDKVDFNKMTFTGDYKATDSLEDILQTISLLNNLKIERIGSKYSIKK